MFVNHFQSFPFLQTCPTARVKGPQSNDKNPTHARISFRTNGILLRSELRYVIQEKGGTLDMVIAVVTPRHVLLGRLFDL